MKTAFLNKADKAWTIEVVVWEGNAQREYFASSYAGAQKIVDERHRNAYDPRFYNREGERLVDNGQHLVTSESRIAEAVQRIRFFTT